MLPSCQVVCRPLSLSYRQSYRILRGTCHKRVETHEGYHTLSGQSKDPDDSDISLLSTSSPLVLTTPIGSKKHSNIIKNSWTVGPGVRRLGPESGAVLRVRRRLRRGTVTATGNRGEGRLGCSLRLRCTAVNGDAHTKV